MKKTDPDQQAVYYAERVAFENTLFAEDLHSDDFITLAEMLFASDWWERNKVPVPHIEPTTSRDTTSYAWVHLHDPSRDPIIRIAPHDINVWILTHEAAHVAQYHLYPGAAQSHGQEFRDTYLEVARIVLGDEAADNLAANFRMFIPLHGSPYRPDFSASRPDVLGVGLYPSWRLEKHLQNISALDLAPTISRVNGAIAL